MTALGLVLAVPCLADESFQRECERRLPATRINVVVEPLRIVRDDSQSVTELTRRKRIGQFAVTLGLTESTMTSKMNWMTTSLRDAKGNACLRPNIEVKLSLEPTKVSVGREFPPGSCAHTSILQHEYRHVQANQRQADWVAKDLQVRLTAHFKQTVFYGNPDALRAQVSSAMSNYWMPLANKQLALVDQVHGQIDSAEEYARNNTVCNGEIPRRLKGP